MRADAVIVSAGKGERLAEGMKKQFLPLCGKPILAHTLDQFETCPLVQTILLVVGQEDRDYCLKEIVERYSFRKVAEIIPGGKRRQDSVKNGLDRLSKDVRLVVIHDGVRPFVTRAMIEESIQGAARFGAVVMAMPVRDTIKVAHEDGTVLNTLDRGSLWQIQTPQAFQVRLVREAYQKASEDGFLGTDDASLVERLGAKVHLLPGSYRNIKITTREDVMLARLFLEGNLSETPSPAGSKDP